MARIHELLRQLRSMSPGLADDLQSEVDVLADRRSFGLNFERHTPETVELPGRPVRVGDKVRILAPRGEGARADRDRLWRVTAIRGEVTGRTAALEPLPFTEESGVVVENLTELVVVAEFRDSIYPGLVSTGTVERGADKPYHAVVNAENFHALQALLFTHRGRIDAIYLDPPYNSGARDWKYNNDYVESDDIYRHSKWLAFMERRLLLAKELLKPDDSVLIVTIDEKEYLRLGLLLEQTFPEGNISMVSSVINPAGAGRAADFSRTDEYIFFVRLGRAAVLPEQRDLENVPVVWDTLRRSSLPGRRGNRGPGACGPNQFYPIYVDQQTGRISGIGDPMAESTPVSEAPQRQGQTAVLPIRPDGTEMNWGITPDVAKRRLEDGHLRAGRYTAGAPQPYVISYLTAGIVADIVEGKAVVSGRGADGSVIAHYPTGREKMPTTNWNRPSHDAQRYGTELLKSLLGTSTFPYPKSIYAVEDCLRFFLQEKKEAVVVDFFAGSGTTAHAVMRLNRQDSGRRQSISVTNNEVAAREQEQLRTSGLRPGDAAWERLGICESITKPRIRAAIEGKRPDGQPVEGDYRFNELSPIADGLDENVEFFTLTYEAPLRVQSNREFSRIAPFLWLRAGSRGRRIESLADGWDVADAYGVLEDLDRTDDFLAAMKSAPTARIAYIVTDEDRLFEAVTRDLPTGVEPVRLYQSYLSNFEIDAMRSVR